MDEESTDDDGEGAVEVTTAVVSPHGELGADWEEGRGQFSSDSSMWMMAETDEVRRLERASLADGEGVEGSLTGRWTEMALRRQFSHCCLWKTSFTCSVCDCA